MSLKSVLSNEGKKKINPLFLLKNDHIFDEDLSSDNDFLNLIS